MIQIKVTGLDETIKRLREYKKTIEEKQHIFLERLAKIGIDTAAVKFKDVQYDGDNDVSVNENPEWVDDNRLFITATGQSVTFIEFGTGVHYTEQHPTAAALGFVRGEYGQGKGSRDTWGYYGNPGTNGKTNEKRNSVVLTHGNPPARAMYDAGKEMRERVREVAKEVFGK